MILIFPKCFSISSIATFIKTDNGWIIFDVLMCKENMKAAMELMEKHPERVIEHAVKGMLPKNTLGRAMGMKLSTTTIRVNRRTLEKRLQRAQVIGMAVA